MKTVLEMAREADIEWDLIDEDEGQVWYITKAGLERFARLVRADEFEKCAKLCDARVMGDNNREDMEAKRCAADIRSFRARSNT